MSSVAVASASGFSLTDFEDFLSRRQEPAWLATRRREAFSVYQRLLVEPLDPEEWKRVDIRAFRPAKFHLSTTPPAAGRLDTLLGGASDSVEQAYCGRIEHVDGHCKFHHLDPVVAAKGVLFGSLSQLLVEHAELLAPHLMTKAVSVGRDRFSAWHAAFLSGGTVLYVPRNVELRQPLHSLIALSEEGAADFSHTLIILEEGASATLLEETASATPTATGMHIGCVELLVAKGAHLRYVQLQNWNEKVWHFAHQSARIERDASVQWTVGGLGAKLAHIHQDISLDGEGSQAEVNGVTFATGRQVLSYYTQQTHNAPNTRSDLLYKDVLRDESRVIWRGMIKVAKDAQKTDGYQRNDGLVLSPDARADAIPGLEIEADDVRCTHGATVGRVDEEQVFYLMCRGLSRYEAMHMIVAGFFQRVYDRIPVETVRDTLDKAVIRKLGVGE
jgi:Fe-S cluster assembly protein SufD